MHNNYKDSPRNCLQSTSLLLSKIYVFTTVTLQCIHARLYRIWPPLSLNDSRMTGRNVNMTWSSRIWTSMTIRDMSVFKNAQPICILYNLSWPHCLLVMINLRFLPNSSRETKWSEKSLDYSSLQENVSPASWRLPEQKSPVSSKHWKSAFKSMMWWRDKVSCVQSLHHFIKNHFIINWLPSTHYTWLNQKNEDPTPENVSKREPFNIFANN